MKNGRLSRIAAAAMGIGTMAYVVRGGPARLQAVETSKNGISPRIGAVQDVALRTVSGTFPGKREYAYYGYVKVQAVVANGKLTDVNVLEYPNDNGRSHYINSTVLPWLVQEAVSAQSYKVDLISGATLTSRAFVKSLQEALAAAGL
jgi:uncharacterized protein with FMN-binding domain